MTELVVITGSTGFIGSQVTAAILDVGYRVRLALRKAEQIAALKKLFAAHEEKLDFVIVPDITASDAFNSAFQGVDYVFHLASPMPGRGSDAKKDYIEPAIKGTTSVLEAAAQIPSIKKVVITSSVLALVPLGGLRQGGHRITENIPDGVSVDPNMQFPDGEMGHGMKYSASKILAHQATGAFLKSRTLNFDLITFHPTFVLGPSLVQTSAQEISGINAWLWNSLQSEKPLFPTLCVHVQDVAEAHIRVLSMPVSSGTALLLSGRPFTWTDVVGYVKDNFKEIDVKLKPPFEDQPWVDTSQADNTLAIKWRSMEDIVGSVLKQQLDFQKTGL